MSDYESPKTKREKHSCPYCRKSPKTPVTAGCFHCETDIKVTHTENLRILDELLAMQP